MLWNDFFPLFFFLCFFFIVFNLRWNLIEARNNFYIKERREIEKFFLELKEENEGDLSTIFFNLPSFRPFSLTFIRSNCWSLNDLMRWNLKHFISFPHSHLPACRSHISCFICSWTNAIKKHDLLLIDPI